MENIFAEQPIIEAEFPVVDKNISDANAVEQEANVEANVQTEEETSNLEEGKKQEEEAISEKNLDEIMADNEKAEETFKEDGSENQHVSTKDSTNSNVSIEELSEMKKKNPLAALKLMLSLQSSSTHLANSSSTTSLNSVNQDSTEGLLQQLKAKVLEGDLVIKIEQSPSECVEIKSLVQKLNKSDPPQDLLAFLIEFGPLFEQLSHQINQRSSTLKNKDQEVRLYEKELNSLRASQDKIEVLEAEAVKDEKELAEWDSKIIRYKEEIKILQTKLSNAEYQRGRVQERMGNSSSSKKEAEAVAAIEHLENANQHQVTIAQLNKDLSLLDTFLILPFL